MKKDKTFKSEYLVSKWAKHIANERNISSSSAGLMAQQIYNLQDYLQYGHAAIAYYKQDGTFCLARATLRHYHRAFKKPYTSQSVRYTVVYQEIGGQQQWRTFRVENFLAWIPIV